MKNGYDKKFKINRANDILTLTEIFAQVITVLVTSVLF